MSPTCPPEESLSRWIDGQLEGAELHEVEEHIVGCSTCAQVLALWAGDIVSLREIGRPETKPGIDCPSPEDLVLLVDRELPSSEAAMVRRHAERCGHCAAELRLVAASAVALGAEPSVPVRSGRARRIRQVIHGLRAPQTRRQPIVPWAIAAVLAVGFASVLYLSSDPQHRLSLGGPMANMFGGGRTRPALTPISVVDVDEVSVRAEPEPAGEVIARWSRGTLVSPLEQRGEWARVVSADVTGWVPITSLAPK